MKVVVAGAVLIACLAGCGESTAHHAAVGTTPTSAKSTNTSRTTTTTLPTLAPGAKDSFTATPTVATIGDRITYRGEGCSGEVQTATAGGPVLTIRPDANGSWSATSVVSDRSGIGRVEASATCLPGAPVDRYTPIFIEVSTYRHLIVEPGTSVQAGTTLTIHGVGACPSDLHGMAVNLSTQHYGQVPGTKDLVFPTDANGNWSTTLAIPTSTPPGAYVLNAQCIVFRVEPVEYTPLPITVLGTDGAIPRTR